MSIRTLIEVNHDFIQDLDIGDIGRALRHGTEMPHGVKLLAQRHHSDPQFAAPKPRETPWTAHRLRTRTVIRSADGGLVCTIESGADREQVDAMVAAVNGYTWYRVKGSS